MDLPLRLLNGELLYRDVHYLYPPFSPYFNSLLYRIFGAHIGVLQAGGAICAVLVVLMCYRIARRLMTPSESALAVIAVVLVCVFKPAGNLIWPYAFAALHSTVFALGAWIDEHYQLVKVCGESRGEESRGGDTAFFVKIFELRDARGNRMGEFHQARGPI